MDTVHFLAASLTFSTLASEKPLILSRFLDRVLLTCWEVGVSLQSREQDIRRAHCNRVDTVRLQLENIGLANAYVIVSHRWAGYSEDS